LFFRLFVWFGLGVRLAAKLSRGFVGGYELDLLLMAISISLLQTGPGRISIEWNVLKRELFAKGKQAVLQHIQKLQR
jgi:putative oxidoreductase